jgi:hypothetical protein
MSISPIFVENVEKLESVEQLEQAERNVKCVMEDVTSDADRAQYGEMLQFVQDKIAEQQ